MKRVILWIVCALVTVLSASADPVEYGGHYYDFVYYGGTWDVCDAYASTLTYQGLSGHLVTFNTQAEYDFVVSCGFDGPWSIGWVGAYSDGTTFQWTNGEGPLQTSTWASDPMANYDTSKYGVTMGGTGYGSDLTPKDASETAPCIVEYQAVPEPAPVGMLLAGCALLMCRRRFSTHCART